LEYAHALIRNYDLQMTFSCRVPSHSCFGRTAVVKDVCDQFADARDQFFSVPARKSYRNGSLLQRFAEVEPVIRFIVFLPMTTKKSSSTLITLEDYRVRTLDNRSE
jgi:hypothetical protein